MANSAYTRNAEQLGTSHDPFLSYLLSKYKISCYLITTTFNKNFKQDFNKLLCSWRSWTDIRK